VAAPNPKQWSSDIIFPLITRENMGKHGKTTPEPEPSHANAMRRFLCQVGWFHGRIGAGPSPKAGLLRFFEPKASGNHWLQELVNRPGVFGGL